MRRTGKESFEGEVFAGADCFQGCDQEIVRRGGSGIAGAVSAAGAAD